MNRKQALSKAFQRGHLLNSKNKNYLHWINKFIIEEVKGDIGWSDITSNSVLGKGKKVKAIIYSRSTGIVAGIEEVSFLLKDSKIKIKPLIKDSSKIKSNTKIMSLEGNEKDILKLERSCLDIISRMSGIATLTYNLKKITKNKIGIAPTRKTQWRYMDKKAVFVGGGLTHRLALWESILIKDNHLAALKRNKVKNIIETALENAWKYRKKANFIEIEVTTKEQAIRAAKKFKELKRKKEKIPCLIMLDNMKPKKIKEIINTLKNLDLIKYALIEASGGITPNKVKEYSNSGADVMSMGYLTNSSRALDIKLKIL